MFMHTEPTYDQFEERPHRVSDTKFALVSPEISHSTSRRTNVETIYGSDAAGHSSNAITSKTRGCLSHIHNLISSCHWRNTQTLQDLGTNQNNDTNDYPNHRGWRKAVSAAIFLTAIVFLLNLSFTIVLMVKFGAKNGVGLIYQGDCSVVKRSNTVLHLLINVLSTLLLGASNYAMQCLSAPNRTEVDNAHAKCISLDIGVLSIRNFLHMRPMKGILWLLLSLSALPLAFFWNSAIFTTGAANSSSYLVVDEGFLSGSPFQTPQTSSLGCGNHTYIEPLSAVDFIYDKYRSGKFMNTSAGDCFAMYSNGDGSRYSNLILVTKPNTTMDMSECGYQSQTWNGSSVLAIYNELTQGEYWPLQSMNVSLFPYQKYVTQWVKTPWNFWEPEPDSTVEFKTKKYLMGNITQEFQQDGIWHFGPYPIHYCLVEVFAPPCKLQFASFILYTVVACNFTKLICLSFTIILLWDNKEPILATIGDAASSFLENRDETTRKMCLIDHSLLQTHRVQTTWRQNSDGRRYQDETPFWKYHKSKNTIRLEYRRNPTKRLQNAELRSRKMTALCFGLLFWFVGWLAFWLTTTEKGALSSAKFGAVSVNGLLNVQGDSGFGLFVDIIIANCFQVFFSAFYVFYNSTLTARWGALEWASYAQQNLKPLRVSWPQGQQQSTYFIQLPWKYGIPLIILQMLMHFFISQSIFLARLVKYDTFGNPTDGGYSTVGYSASAALTAVICWTVICLALIGSGFIKVDNRIPSHGNQSVVISALCHTDISRGRQISDNSFSQDDEANKFSSKPLMWGVTEEPWESCDSSGYHWGSGPSVPGHCTFSDQAVELPKQGLCYS